MLRDVLVLTEGLPEQELAAGEVLYVEGDPSRTIVVLVHGELAIEAGGELVNRYTTAGAFVGETGALLHQDRAATVTAVGPTVIRVIGDPEDFFDTHPQVGLELARQLAGRLHRLNAYVADVQRQFAHEEGHLGVFHELLHRIADRPAVDIEPGSDRSPDY